MRDDACHLHRVVHVLCTNSWLTAGLMADCWSHGWLLVSWLTAGEFSNRLFQLCTCVTYVQARTRARLCVCLCVHVRRLLRTYLKYLHVGVAGAFFNHGSMNTCAMSWLWYVMPVTVCLTFSVNQAAQSCNMTIIHIMVQWCMLCSRDVCITNDVRWSAGVILEAAIWRASRYAGLIVFVNSFPRYPTSRGRPQFADIVRHFTANCRELKQPPVPGDGIDKQQCILGLGLHHSDDLYVLICRIRTATSNSYKHCQQNLIAKLI